MQIPYETKARPDTGLWNAKIGIWLFLASEVMLFGGLFSGYVFLRLGSHGEADYFWPEGVLNVSFGFVNTIILILSSVFVVVAWLQLKLRDYRKFQIWMALVVICAAVFLVNKGFEYNAKFNHYGIKLSDNSIVEGHGIDDTIKYEGITDVEIYVKRYNGEFLEKVVGDTAPTFREVRGGAPGGEAIELTAKNIRKIADRRNDELKKEHAATMERLKKENVEIKKQNESLPKSERKELHNIVRWLPAMEVKSLQFVATSPFAISAEKDTLRKTFPDSVKFLDQSTLMGSISAETPGLILESIDRIDLRAADPEDIESSLVWANLTHHADAALKHYIEHRDHVLQQAEAEGHEPSFDDLFSQKVEHDDDHHVSIVVPWDQVKLYSNFTPKWNTYYAIYFTLTGLHGLHVFLGAVVLFYFGFMSKKLYEKDPEHLANRVEVGGLFWHFVDLVWIFLFPILYLM